MSKATRIAALNAALTLRTGTDALEDVLQRATEINEWLDPDERPAVAPPSQSNPLQRSADKIKGMTGKK